VSSRPTRGLTVLVMAKAPVAGRVKTRLGAHVGAAHAADLAAAALLDTIDAVADSGASGYLSLAGDLSGARRGAEISRALAGWTVTGQRGAAFAERLVRAHADAGDGLVVQIGMDTPQVTGDQLRAAAADLGGDDAVLGPAHDGGWWTLVRREARVAEALAAVTMSTPTTCTDTEVALRRAGHRVGRTVALLDVDDVDDARAVAAAHPGTRFARAWAALPAEAR
jgi:glycosyltransferase A (GT-A) superfamily protein (DUF2064 family)